MVLRIKENELFNRENYSVFDDNHENIASININNNKAHKADFNILLNNGDYVRCYYNLLKNKYIKGFARSITTTSLLDKSDNLIGSIILKTSDNKGLKYYFKEIEYKNHIFRSYEIGMGSDGYFTMLYDGNRVVGAVSKDNVVYMNKDTYSVYMEDDMNILMIMIILTLRWDADISEGYANSTRNDELTIKRIDKIITPQEELVAKYDPTFIPRIKQRDGIAD